MLSVSSYEDACGDTVAMMTVLARPPSDSWLDWRMTICQKVMTHDMRNQEIGDIFEVDESSIQCQDTLMMFDFVFLMESVTDVACKRSEPHWT